MDKISVVVPCYNEEEALPVYYKEMCRVMDEMKDVVFELIFVDDGSSDATLGIMKDLNEKDSRCRYLSFSRNFGTMIEPYDGTLYLNGVSLTSYKVVKHGEFAYVADTSRRGDKIALAFNSTKNEILISSIYTVFRVTRVDLLDADYLFMYFNRPEFDRYSRFNSWGSARETFDWSEMCDIEIDLPPLDIQQKYVDVYNAMLANQQSYERGLEDLKLTCDAYIEELRRNTPSVAIGKYLMPSDERNTLNLSADSVRGLSVSKDMIETKANMNGVSVSNYKTVPPRYIAYVSDTSRRGDKMSLGFNRTEEMVCSLRLYNLISQIKLRHNLRKFSP